jgi:hypothetical protein
MFSQEDRRRLDAIEEQLLTDDPGLARRLSWPTSARRWSRVGAITLIVSGILGMFIGVFAFSVGLVVVFLATALGGWIWLDRALLGDRGA